MAAKPTKTPDRNLHFLVVDDDETVALAAKAELSQLGHRCDSARDGEQALEQLAASNALPDCVLTDLRMPVLDGFELLERIKRQYPHLPVAVLTAYGSLDATKKALRLGAFDFLRKPLVPVALDALCTRLLVQLRAVDGVLSQLDDGMRYRFQCDMPSRRASPRILASAATNHVLSALPKERMDALKLRVALMEALENALVHGNLGMLSEAKEQDPAAFEAELLQRLTQEQYAQKRLRIEATIEPQRLELVVSDEGEGFAPESVSMEEDALSLTGRGLILIRSQFPDVHWSDGGRRIHMLWPLRSASEP